MALTLFFGSSGAAGDDDTHLHATAVQVQVDTSGDVYVHESPGGAVFRRIRRISPTGTMLGNAVEAEAPSSGNGQKDLLRHAASADLFTGYAYSPHWEIWRDGSLIAGAAAHGQDVVEGTGTGAGLGYLNDLYAVDSTAFAVGLHEGLGGQSRILRVTSGGTVTDDYAHLAVELIRVAATDATGAMVYAAAFSGTDMHVIAFEPDGSNALLADLGAVTLADLLVAADGSLFALLNTPTGGRIDRINTTTGAPTTIESWATTNAADSFAAGPDGALYVLFTAGPNAHTIQKRAGAFTAPTHPLMSTLTDTFATLGPTRWATNGPAAATDGVLRLGDPLDTGYAASVDRYDFDLAQVRLISPGFGVALWVTQEGGTDFLKLLAEPAVDSWSLRAQWNVGSGVQSTETPITYNAAEHKWLRIVRTSPTAVAFEASADGVSWTTIDDITVPSGALRETTITLIGENQGTVDNVNILVPPPDELTDTLDPWNPDADFPGSGDDPGTGPGGTDPTGTGPGGGNPKPGGATPPDPICTTIIELIRQFSAAVRRPVRITGPNRIEMVDINAPLPTGWATSDAADCYTTTGHELIAGEKTLSLQAGSLALHASADLVTDDVRLLVSDWAMPHRLPIYALHAGLVKRVSYTFTPHTFRGSVEYHLRPVPLTIQRS